MRVAVLFKFHAVQVQVPFYSYYCTCTCNTTTGSTDFTYLYKYQDFHEKHDRPLYTPGTTVVQYTYSVYAPRSSLYVIYVSTASLAVLRGNNMDATDNK